MFKKDQHVGGGKHFLPSRPPAGSQSFFLFAVGVALARLIHSVWFVRPWALLTAGLVKALDIHPLVRKPRILFLRTVQVAGQAALGGDALALLQVVLDDDGLHVSQRAGLRVQRAGTAPSTDRSSGLAGARWPQLAAPAVLLPRAPPLLPRQPQPPCSPCVSRACAGLSYRADSFHLGDAVAP